MQVGWQKLFRGRAEGMNNKGNIVAQRPTPTSFCRADNHSNKHHRPAVAKKIMRCCFSPAAMKYN